MKEQDDNITEYKIIEDGKIKHIRHIEVYDHPYEFDVILSEKEIKPRKGTIVNTNETV